MSNTEVAARNQRVRVWDIWVRLFHWSLAAAVIFQLVSGSTSWQFFNWHRSIGELVLALVVFRLLWGMVGSSNARLTALVRDPRAALGHLSELARGRSEPARGHDAAGSWAVIALLMLVSVQAITGLFIADEDEFIEGAFYGVLDSDATRLMDSVHHWNANFLMALVAVHVVMVLVYLVIAKRNLIGPMITGWMRWPAVRSVPDVRFGAWYVGLASALLCGTGIGWLLGWY